MQRLASGRRRSLSRDQGASNQRGAQTPDTGYRYVHRQEGVLGHLVIDETEADLVRQLFSWLTEERMDLVSFAGSRWS